MEQDFRHIVEGAAAGSVQPRAQVAVAGKDRASFLQGFLTNDVEALRPGAGCYAAWLTPQGRMLTDMHVLESEGMMLLDLPASTAEATLARLDQFHFGEDVTLSALSGSLTSLWLHGPRAAAALETAVRGGRRARDLGAVSAPTPAVSGATGRRGQDRPAGRARLLRVSAAGRAGCVVDYACRGWSRRRGAGGDRRRPDRGGIPDFRRRT